jgi:hypothetical protein
MLEEGVDWREEEPERRGNNGIERRSMKGVGSGIGNRSKKGGGD